MCSGAVAQACMAAIVVGAALTGCEAAKEKAIIAKDTALGVAKSAGEYVSTGAQKVGDFIAGRRTRSVAVDDGSECYPKQVAFDEASEEVALAHRKATWAKVGIVGGGLVATYAESTVTKVAALGFSAVMLGVLNDLESDRTRIVKVTSTFNELVRCRTRERRAITSQVSAGKLGRKEGQERLDRLRASVKEDVAFAEDTNQLLKDRNEAFATTVQRLKTEAPPPQDAAERKERAQQTKKAEAAVQTNQSVLQQQSASVEEAARLAKDGDGFKLSWLLLRDWPRLALLAAARTHRGEPA